MSNETTSAIENIEKLMTEKNVEFRSFKINNVEERKNDDGELELVVEGVACVFNKETVLYHGKNYELKEVVDRSALNKADMSDVIFNYNHCGRVYARTRNKSLELSLKEDGLHMRAVLMAEDEGHKQLYRDIKSGLLDKMSFAFFVEKSEFNYVEDKSGYISETRTILEISRVLDVSVVDFPAYDTTSISARRALGAVSFEERAVSIRQAKNKLKLKLKLEGV